ncbi:MAG: HAMP domain-containing sensor histidine kinase [Nibricoccus sp.]
MASTSRRLFFYWLLLLASALGVGAGAWLLLRREEARLTLRKSSTEAARKAAVESRAQLVAENVELFVGDVENGLIDILAEMPASGLDANLDGWERNNPLVRTSYRCALDGRLLRPNGSVTSDDARGFRRRFAARLLESPPWSGRAPTLTFDLPAPAKQTLAEEQAFQVEDNNRQQVTSNVSKVQSARKETQSLARAKTSSYGFSDERKDLEKREADADKKKVLAAAAPAAARAPEIRGWTPMVAEGRLHLLGWVRPAGSDEVRGVEVEMTALVSRLSGALPSELATDEGYILRDDKGRVIHQAGKVPENGATPAARIPLASALLPGWEVAAYLVYAPMENGGGFFTIGLLLAGILVVAILVGGSLLLFQARSSAADAAQKTSFVANVSHEFKTPLTTIRLYSELLEQGRVAENEKRNDYLRTIGRETQRLARLVNNVLDFSRLEQGRKKYQREPLDLTAALAQLLDVHAPRIAEAGLELKRDLPVEIVSVVTDRDAVEQIVLNLLDNACKYACDGHEALVTLRRRASGGAEIVVSDRGRGVPTGHRERIFEKFHRVDETLTAEKGGAGLGLSIARQLARGLGGELRYQTRTGGGAEFVLELP